jgi:hypothetical protein
MEILKYLKTVELPAVKKFLAKDKFQIGTHDGVKIAWLGDNFKNHFLGIKGVNIPATKLQVYNLREASQDLAIIAELGGEGLVETTLAHLWAMLKQQGQGEDKDGGLLVNGYANIFYIHDVDNHLWAVRCYWDAGDGWDVGASPITYPRDWRAGHRVFSRDSDPLALEVPGSVGSLHLSSFDSLNAKIDLIGSDVKKLLKHLGVDNAES